MTPRDQRAIIARELHPSLLRLLVALVLWLTVPVVGLVSSRAAIAWGVALAEFGGA